MAFILSPMLDLNIRRGFNYSPNGLAEFFTRPLSCAFIVIGLGTLIYGFAAPAIKKARAKKNATKN